MTDYRPLRPTAALRLVPPVCKSGASGESSRDLPADVAVARYLSDRERGGERRNQLRLPPYHPPVRYTLHLSFLAADLAEARAHAVTYAEGLATLRPEVGVFPALLSRADAWNHVEPLSCAAVGPEGEVCADVYAHPGWHRAAGLGALSWGDGDGDGDTPRWADDDTSGWGDGGGSGGGR